jgi:hypothetical protein
MDLYNFVKLDPYPHKRQQLDQDRNLDQHVTQAHPGALEARNGAMEANNGAIDDSEAQKWV